MTRTLGFAFLASTIAACTTAEPPAQPASDDLAGETGDGDAAKADSPHDTFGFIAVSKGDTCTTPIGCTPYTLTRANRSTIECNDNEYHSSCKVGAISWTSVLSETATNKVEAALDKGGVQVLVKGSYKIYVDFLAFVPTEVWLAQLPDGDTSGTFVQVFDWNAECQRMAACPTMQEFKLNSNKMADLEGLDFGSDASDSLQGKVTKATAAAGAIVVGSRETRNYVDFIDTLRSVGQVYLKQ